MSEIENLSTEARIVSNYLLNQNPSKREIALYIDAVKKTSITLNKKETRIWSFIMKHPLFIGCIDGALALTDSSNQVRKKIFIMLAVLEASPNYCHLFLPFAFCTFF